MYQDHPNGAWIDKLPVGRGLKIQTQNTLYTVRKLNDGTLTIEGNRKYCPSPVQCNIHGSTFGGSMIRVGYVGRGMFLEVGLPHGVMTTSKINEVEEVI